MRIRVVATANARESQIVGWEDDPRAGRILRVRVAAPPVAGKANSAIAVLLAGYLGVSRSQVRLVAGTAARVKSYEVPDGSLPGDGRG
jgi:uncharacterized protein YggU (UPF0235/DUF167 family)